MISAWIYEGQGRFARRAKERSFCLVLAGDLPKAAEGWVSENAFFLVGFNPVRNFGSSELTFQQADGSFWQVLFMAHFRHAAWQGVGPFIYPTPVQRPNCYTEEIIRWRHLTTPSKNARFGPRP